MPRSSSGLGRRPLTPVTRVQIPYGVQIENLETLSLKIVFRDFSYVGGADRSLFTPYQRAKSRALLVLGLSTRGGTTGKFSKVLPRLIFGA